MPPPGDARAIHVRPIAEEGIDVDAAPLVEGAVKRAIAAGPSVHLASAETADATLSLVLVEASASLGPLADPSLRAAQYRAVVRVTAVLTAPDGRVLWRSPVITGAAPFHSPSGPLEQLDGARRNALARAATEAARALLTSMLYAR